jgi:hypothetical protein
MEKKMNRLAWLVILLILAACAPTPEQMAQPVAETVASISTATPYPTHTAYPTLTPYPTHTPNPTYTIPPTQTARVIIVTPTSTPTPKFTPTETTLPTETMPPTPTIDPLYADKSAGFYLVGIDIGAGVWRSDGQTDDCYWSITSKTGDIINNHFGMGGGTMYVMASGYQVELGDDCGTWTYLGQ